MGMSIVHADIKHHCANLRALLKDIRALCGLKQLLVQPSCIVGGYVAMSGRCRRPHWRRRRPKKRVEDMLPGTEITAGASFVVKCSLRFEKIAGATFVGGYVAMRGRRRRPHWHRRRPKKKVEDMLPATMRS